MKQYNITGMNCAACSARVEKAVSKVEGVKSCSVSLLTNSMSVEGEASPENIIKAVENAGYGASEKGAKADTSNKDSLADTLTPALVKRLIYSAGFLIVLMYFSMGHMMWNLPVPEFFESPQRNALLQLIITAVIMVINQQFFISGFKSFIYRSPNMDTLVALGSMSAFVYSTCVLFVMVTADYNTAMEYMQNLYFESAAMILTLITIGKMLEARAKGKTTDAIKSLVNLAPKTATVIRDDKEVKIKADEVKQGDIFVVRPGESIPVDGIVTEGESAVNEAALTGESIPVDKTAGDSVSAATINQSGFIKCQATRVGEDTALSQIIKLVSDAAATKAPIGKVADKVSGVFVPVVISLALITTLVWLAIGKDIGTALSFGISVLVISCPCALGLATPVAVMVGSGVGAKNGIMFKTASALEETGRITCVVLDKTGTVTKGQPKVTDIIPAEGEKEELIKTALSLECKSEHPLARAIVAYGEENSVTYTKADNFKALPGNGLQGEYKGSVLTGGSMKYISTVTEIPKKLAVKAEELANQGKTPLFFAKDNKLTGIIAVADVIKEDSPQAVMGIEVIMLTGDNEKTANAIGRQVGVDKVISGILPQGKERIVRELTQTKKVAMVGDGINDTPALTAANIGIAIGSGTDVAIDAAEVVLMKNSLRDVPGAIRLSRKTLKNIHENLFWAFIYNIIGIPLAAGVWVPIFGWQLNPMFGAAAMSLSSFCVVTNALRLNLYNIYDTKRDKPHKIKKEKKVMKKTMKIEGMMCSHCEARVKKCLEGIEGVVGATVSHEAGTAIVELSKDISADTLKNAVEAQDYKVISIE